MLCVLVCGGVLSLWCALGFLGVSLFRVIFLFSVRAWVSCSEMCTCCVCLCAVVCFTCAPRLGFWDFNVVSLLRLFFSFRCALGSRARMCLCVLGVLVCGGVFSL